MANEAGNKDLSTMANILKKVKLFQNLDEKTDQEIINRITLEYYPQGHTIFKESDAGDFMYIIFKGSARIFHPGESASFEKEVAIMKEGDFFGEMALLSEPQRFATAVTLEDCELFKINKEGLEKMLTEISSIGEHISSEFLRRFKENMRKEQQNS